MNPTSLPSPRYYVLTYGGEPVSQLYDDEGKAKQDLAERNEKYPHDQEQRSIVPLFALPPAAPQPPEPPYAQSFGYALAMGVLQSDRYPTLDDQQRAECDKFIARGLGRASTAPQPDLHAAIPQQPNSDSFWLIERGQNQGHRVTEWWCDGPGNACGWQTDWSKATRFDSAYEAESRAKRRLMFAGEYAVTSHGIIGSNDTAYLGVARPSEDLPPARDERARQSLRRDAFAKVGAELFLERLSNDTALVRLHIGHMSFGICQPRNGTEAASVLRTFRDALTDLLMAARELSEDMQSAATVLDRGFKYENGVHTPTVLVGFPPNDWDSRDDFAARIAASTALVGPVTQSDPK